jgi:glycosyltransferase involved in cell wall biosynthesis
VDPPESLRVFEVRKPYTKREHSKAWMQFKWRLRLKRAQRYLAGQGCQRTVLSIWRPTFAEALDQVANDLSCYHIDDEYSFSSTDEPISPSEQRLLESCDCVFIHSRSLMAKKGGINPNTRMAPNGVDFSAYSKPVDMPRDLAAIPRPRVLYSGRIKRQMDWSLLGSLAQLEPRWQFVFVGPAAQSDIQAQIEELDRHPNVHFLGGKNPQELPGYVHHSDVCIMPYVLDGYTKYILPLKLHEYLAAGKPVVSSPIDSVLPFADVVMVASTVDEWQSKVAAGLSEKARSAKLVVARQEVARRYDWDPLVRDIAQTMTEALGPPYVGLFRERASEHHRSVPQ